MKTKSSLIKPPTKAPAERVVKDIRRQARRHFLAEDKIRIVLDGLRGVGSIAELCRKEAIARACITPSRKSSWNEDAPDGPGHHWTIASVGRRWSEAEPEGDTGDGTASGAGGRYPSELCGQTVL